MNSDAASNPYMISQPTEMWSALRRICPVLGRKPPAFAQSDVIPEFHPSTAPSPQGIPVDQQRVSPRASQREVLHTGVHTAPEQKHNFRPSNDPMRVGVVHTSPYWSWKTKDILLHDRARCYSGNRFIHFDEGLRPFFWNDDVRFLQELYAYKKKIEVEIEKLLRNRQAQAQDDALDDQWIPWVNTPTKSFFSSPVSLYPTQVILSRTQIYIRQTIEDIEKLEKTLSALKNLWNRDEDHKNNAEDIQEWEQWKYAHYAQGSTEAPHDKGLVNKQETPQALLPGLKPVCPREDPIHDWNTLDNTVTWDKPVASGTTLAGNRNTERGGESSIHNTIHSYPVGVEKFFY
jgi:hypothetical protein